MRTRRLARAVPAGLLAVALLAACGNETEPEGESAAQAPDSSAPTLSSRTLGGDPLDQIDATAALLAEENLPESFELDGSLTVAEPPAESDGLPACETSDSFEDRFDYARTAVTRVGQDHLFVDDSRLLFVSSLVSSFQNEDQAAAAVDEIALQFADCTDFVDEQGTTSVSIELEHDDVAATDDVDDQFNMTATGTYEEPDVETFMVGFGFSLARVDNNVTLTQVVSLGVPEDRTLLAPYTEIAVDRLVAIMNDETPEATVGPEPTSVPASRLPVDPSQFSVEQFDQVAPRFGLPG
jgi:hypothetical protein